MAIPNSFDRYIAVDWSGAVSLSGQRKKIWVADLCSGEVKLTGGRTRKQVTDWLSSSDVLDGRAVLVGLDFAFSLPRWFIEERFHGSVRELWSHCSEDNVCALFGSPPFWGRAKAANVPVAVCTERERVGGEPYRETEKRISARGRRPGSVFKLVGPSQVGCGSLRGFATLVALKEAGFAIWPFDAATARAVVEIYPRMFYDATVKTNPDARRTSLKQLLSTGDICVEEVSMQQAADSDDAFHALVSAVGLSRQEISFVISPHDALIAPVEGWIYPAVLQGSTGYLSRAG